MKSEKDVKARVKKLLDQYHAWWFMPFQAGFGKAGVPDFICCVNGHFLGIETKYGGNKPAAHQALQLERIRTARGYSLVVDEHNLPLLEGIIMHLVVAP